MKNRMIVDGMNVIGSRPDGWWRDRKGAILRLADQLERYAQSHGDEVVVVFDGPRSGGSPRSRRHLRVEFTPDRRQNAADDAIVARVAADTDPSSLNVVTSDVRLADRVRAHGAGVTGARSFRGRLDAVTESSTAD
jgi:predicted RNA-binding protein with PIN domain